MNVSRTTIMVYTLMLAIGACVYGAYTLQAAPPISPYLPGESLDPNCAPGDLYCSVAVLAPGDNVSELVNNVGYLTQIAIGDTITGGASNQVLFLDGAGNLTSDQSFTYDAITGTFVVGAPSTQYTSGSETKFVLDQTTSSVRLGTISGSVWDTGSVGYGSIAIGTCRNPSVLGCTDVGQYYYGPHASGTGSIAIGAAAWATGDRAIYIGMGEGNPVNGVMGAAGSRSVVIGTDSYAPGDRSVAVGWGNKSVGQYSFSTGGLTTASGQASFSGGFQSTASGVRSVAIGNGNIASGDYAVSLGSGNVSSGAGGVTLGGALFARSFFESTTGVYSTDYTPVSATAFNTADRIFTVGNGSSGGTRSDALTVLKNGKVGINIDNFQTVGNQLTPSSAMLQVAGDVAASGDVYAQGIMLTSDERLKENIEDLPLGLATVQALRPVAYDMRKDGVPQFGFIAQEVREILPTLVSENNFLSLNYIGMIPILTKAVQELSTLVADNIAFVEGSTLKTNIVAFLGTVSNGINDLFVRNLRAQDLICIGDTCMTEAQLEVILSTYTSSQDTELIEEPESDPTLPESDTTIESEVVDMVSLETEHTETHDVVDIPEPDVVDTVTEN